MSDEKICRMHKTLQPGEAVTLNGPSRIRFIERRGKRGARIVIEAAAEVKIGPTEPPEVIDGSR